jgi:thiamine-monophosphate kinase
MVRVRELGEFGLIERLRDQLAPEVRLTASVPLGVGDDAAVWVPTPGYNAVVTTDALVDGVHFRLDWTDWRSLGHKMLAVNVSDIAAMGALPRLATVVLGLTGEEDVGDLESLYQGASDLASAYGVAVAGGDVVRSPGGCFLSVTLMGEVEPGQAVRRDGARAGDLIVVSGTLGASAAGMRLIADGREAATAGLLIAAHLRPVPRVGLGRIMHDAGVTAGMDLSDGLAGDLRKIMAASRVSAVVELDQVPALPAVRALFPDDWRNLAIRGGEDYELLMTIPEDRFAMFAQRAEQVGATVTSIGRIVEADDGPELTLLEGGLVVEIGEGAWDHFGDG